MMEKNRIGPNMPVQPNEGNDYVTITSCGVPHNWKEDPFGEKEPAEQAPVASDLQQPLKDEVLDDRKD